MSWRLVRWYASQTANPAAELRIVLNKPIWSNPFGSYVIQMLITIIIETALKFIGFDTEFVVWLDRSTT